MKRTIIITPFKDCKLEITGNYTPEETENGFTVFQGEFETKKLEWIKGNLLEFMDKCRDNFNYLNYLEQLAVEECKTYEPDYEND